MIALLLALAPVAVCHDIDGGRIGCKSAWAVDPHWKRPIGCAPDDCSPRCAPRTVYGVPTACSAWTERLPSFQCPVGPEWKAIVKGCWDGHTLSTPNGIPHKR